MTSHLTWYAHRLRAMGPAEMVRHAQRRWLRQRDTRRHFPEEAERWTDRRPFPCLPNPEDAPNRLRVALEFENTNLTAGRWYLFGHLPVQVDDPPRWHRDYVAGIDLETTLPALRLDHRALRERADIRAIWEINRWSQLVRLAQASFVLGEPAPAAKCLDWLEDWSRVNPPFRGWNWTSALEAGIRLIQFTWIDALLSAAGGEAAESRLAPIRALLIPPHAHFAWRHRSFGSSANNHLLGELAGLIVAGVRWPNLLREHAPLSSLARLLEREILAQFAPDGGNREQALNYHLFALEFAWQARMALAAAGHPFSRETEQRLCRAGRFFAEVQVIREPWDYGDSDSAWVTPLFAQEGAATPEWHHWLSRRGNRGSLDYWLGNPPSQEPPIRKGPPLHTRSIADWWLYPDTGIAIQESGYWFLRWDLSPLGYLKTAAHGHLDALHLSIWWDGEAVTIDPGTGVYYADPALRTWFTSRAAHNAPCPDGPEHPRRIGPFLWAESHERPRLDADDAGRARARMRLPGCELTRIIQSKSGGMGWVVDDAVRRSGKGVPFTVTWQFPPESTLRTIRERHYRLRRRRLEIDIVIEGDWASVHSGSGVPSSGGQAPTAGPGLASPMFRRVEPAPFLTLRAGGTGTAPDKSCLFRTSFVRSRVS